MADGETHEFGASSLDLSNHYYGGPESEKLRFIQYCQDTLAESASNGNISSDTFLDVLQKYCYYRHMRGSVCRAAETLSFESLPPDVRVAFANELCHGDREARLACANELTSENEVIFVPEEWSYGICSTTYPLTVSYDTSAAHVEEHSFSTNLGSGYSTYQGFDSNQQPSTYSNSDPGSIDTKDDLFKQSYSQQMDEDDTKESDPTMAPISLPTTPSQASGSPKKGSKSKKAKSPAPTQRITLFPTLRTAGEPSLSPTSKPAPLSSEEAALLEPTSPIPSWALSVSPSQVLIELTPTYYPTRIGDYSAHSTMDSSIVPKTPSRSNRSEDGYSYGMKDSAAAAVMFLIVFFVPLFTFFLVKQYQKHRDSVRRGQDPALLEDFSVVSENSAVLVAMGSKFKRSDDLSDSDVESNPSSILLISQAKGMAQRIRQAFNRMYEYIDDEISISQEYNQRHAEHRTEVDSTAQADSMEVFVPNENSSSEGSIGVLRKIDPGTMLLPADEMYTKEFVADFDSPVIYHSDKRKRNRPSSSRAFHPGSLPIDDGPTESLIAPIPLMKETKHRSVPQATDPPVQSYSSDSDDAKTTKAIQIDVSHAKEKSDCLRIVGLADDSYPSDEMEASPDEASDSSHFEEEGPVNILRQTTLRKLSSRAKKMMSPNTFDHLSRELDEMMCGDEPPTKLPSTKPQPKSILRKTSSYAGRRTNATDYNFVSAISSLTHSTTSTISDATPVVGNTGNWPRNTYTLDVLGEQITGPIPSRTGSKFLGDGSYRNESDEDSLHKEIISRSPSVSSREDGVETMLMDTGDVAVTSIQSAKRHLRSIT